LLSDDRGLRVSAFGAANMISHGELIGVWVLAAVGAALVALAPARKRERPAG